MTQRLVHAPDHPVWTGPGPAGMYAHGCKRDDCDWFGVSKPGSVGEVVHLEEETK